MATTFPVSFINDTFTDNGGPFATPWNAGSAANITDDDSDATAITANVNDGTGALTHEFQVDDQSRPDLLFYELEIVWEISAVVGGASNPIMSLNWEHKDGGNFAEFAQLASGGTTKSKRTETFSLKPFSSAIFQRVAGADVKWRLIAAPNGAGNSMSCHVYAVRFKLKNRYSTTVHEG